MTRHSLLGIPMLLVLLLAKTAAGQLANRPPMESLSPAPQTAIQWQHDLELAKSLARQTGKAVLVHVWIPECGPCAALEHNVFNQPAVAREIESRFVPVKLNANENPATAQGLGITRVPTDVILTPDGQILARLISPPTPQAYLHEVCQATTSARGDGNQYAAAPPPTAVNAAYAGLQVASNTPPVVAPQTVATSSPHSTAPAAGLAIQQSAQPTVGTSPAVSHPSTSPLNPNLPMMPPTVPAPAQTAAQSPSTSAPASPSAPNPSSASAAPDPRQLPPGAPPLGFDGYCPVSMRHQWKWVPGDPRWGVVHRGRTYWFAGAKEQQQFWTDPDLYSPALSGMDAVLAIDHGQQVPGKREHSIDYDNMFYMFSSEATLQQFTANPERYAAGVRQAMGIQRGRLVR